MILPNYLGNHSMPEADMHVRSRVTHRRLCHAKLIAKAGRFTIDNIQHESQQTGTLAHLSTSAGISNRGCKMPDAQLQICDDKSFLARAHSLQAS